MMSAPMRPNAGYKNTDATTTLPIFVANSQQHMLLLYAADNHRQHVINLLPTTTEFVDQIGQM